MGFPLGIIAPSPARRSPRTIPFGGTAVPPNLLSERVSFRRIPNFQEAVAVFSHYILGKRCATASSCERKGGRHAWGRRTTRLRAGGSFIKESASVALDPFACGGPREQAADMRPRERDALLLRERIRRLVAHDAQKLADLQAERLLDVYKRQGTPQQTAACAAG